MAKPGTNKKRCEAYKARGQREINKKIKQERHEKRMEKFRKRKEEGKTYQYKPNPYNEKSTDKKERRAFYQERKRRAAKNVDHRLPLAKFRSFMAKTQNDLNKINALLKLLKKSEVMSAEINWN